MGAHLSEPAADTRELPATIEIDGATYRRTDVFKSGWLSCVARYRSDEHDVILKRYRAQSLWGIPVRWCTSRMAQREARILRQFEGLQGVPRAVGVWQDCGLVHDFVPGHPLGRGEVLRKDFLDRLDEILAQIHQRGTAYVDLSKRDNVLVGDDGLPWLIDFQIAWSWPLEARKERLLPAFLGRAILERFQSADRHHVLKLRARLAPDSLSSEERAALATPAWPIRLHRFLVKPYQRWRRARQARSV